MPQFSARHGSDARTGSGGRSDPGLPRKESIKTNAVLGKDLHIKPVRESQENRHRDLCSNGYDEHSLASCLLAADNTLAPNSDPLFRSEFQRSGFTNRVHQDRTGSRRNLKMGLTSWLIKKLAFTLLAASVIYLAASAVDLVPQSMKDTVAWFSENFQTLAFSLCFALACYVVLRILNQRKRQVPSAK